MIDIKQKRIALIITFLISILVTVFFSNKVLHFLIGEKIWAHKINTIERLHETKNLFSGVELDVVYYPNGNYFDVNHPPEKSNNLKLQEYFQSQKIHKNRSYWIDFKNLNKSNHINAANKIDSLIKLFNINANNVIIESTNPNLLFIFLHKGYLTSYYLPINLHQLNKEELKTTIQNIKNNISSNNNTYISSNYKDYNVLNKYFPHQKKICWLTTIGSMNILEARLLLYKVALNDNVDVLLIPFY